MAVYAKRKKNYSTHKSAGYRFLLKLKIREMSGFNDSKTAPCDIWSHVNKCLWKTGFIIWSSMILSKKCFQCKVFHSAWCNFCWYTGKMPIWILCIVGKWSKMRENSIIVTFPIRRLYVTDENCLICLLITHQFHTVSFVHWNSAHSSHNHSLSHAAIWVLWIAFLSVR